MRIVSLQGIAIDAFLKSLKSRGNQREVLAVLTNRMTNSLLNGIIPMLNTVKLDLFVTNLHYETDYSITQGKTYMLHDVSTPLIGSGTDKKGVQADLLSVIMDVVAKQRSDYYLSQVRWWAYDAKKRFGDLTITALKQLPEVDQYVPLFGKSGDRQGQGKNNYEAWIVMEYRRKAQKSPVAPAPAPAPAAAAASSSSSSNKDATAATPSMTPVSRARCTRSGAKRAADAMTGNWTGKAGIRSLQQLLRYNERMYGGTYDDESDESGETGEAGDADDGAAICSPDPKLVIRKSAKRRKVGDDEAQEVRSPNPNFNVSLVGDTAVALGGGVGAAVAVGVPSPSPQVPTATPAPAPPINPLPRTQQELDDAIKQDAQRLADIKLQVQILQQELARHDRELQAVIDDGKMLAVEYASLVGEVKVAEEEAKRKAEEAEAKRKAEEEAKRKAEEEAKRKRQEAQHQQIMADLRQLQAQLTAVGLAKARVLQQKTVETTKITEWKEQNAALQRRLAEFRPPSVVPVPLPVPLMARPASAAASSSS